jgi:hypothetical protein
MITILVVHVDDPLFVTPEFWDGRYQDVHFHPNQPGHTNRDALEK